MNEKKIKKMEKKLKKMLAAGNKSVTEEEPAKNRRPPVKLVVNPVTKLGVTPYKNNAEYGYILVEEAQVQQRSLSWVGKVRRTALIKGEIVSLKEWMQDNIKGNKLPGQIVVREFIEGAVPDEMMREFVGDTDTRDYEEAVKPFIKLAGKDGIPLLAGGERIMRFSFYDQTGELEDEKIEHDNGQDVANAAKERRAAKALEMQEQLTAQNQLAEAEQAAVLAAKKLATTTPVPADTTAATPAALPVNNENKK